MTSEISKFVEFKLQAKTLRLLAGAITGHYLFKKHLHTIGVSESALCNRCSSDEESAFHVICSCPTLATKRNNILGAFTLSETEARRLKVLDILKFIGNVDFE